MHLELATLFYRFIINFFVYIPRSTPTEVGPPPQAPLGYDYIPLIVEHQRRVVNLNGLALATLFAPIENQLQLQTPLR